MTLNYHPRKYTQGRALRELSVNSEIDLNWSTTSIEREKLLKPIRIPIYRGLIGWRVLLIKGGTQERFDKITSIEDLRALVAVQRFDWTDYDILKENKFRVEGNLSF